MRPRVLLSIASAVRLIKNSGMTSVAALLEATRDSDAAVEYQDAATAVLVEPPDGEHAEIIMNDIFRQIERQQIELEYRQLSGAGAHSDAERERFQQVSRRLAELKS